MTKSRKQELTAYSIFFYDGSAEVRYFSPIELAGYKRSNEYRKKVLTMKKTASVEIITKIKIY